MPSPFTPEEMQDIADRLRRAADKANATAGAKEPLPYTKGMQQILLDSIVVCAQGVMHVVAQRMLLQNLQIAALEARIRELEQK